MNKHRTAEKWDRHYAVPDYIFGTVPNAYLVAGTQYFPPRGRILVPGDGEGRNGVWLAEQGFDVTSVEASGRGVQKARALAAARGVQMDLHHADLEDWAWPLASFDGVAAIFVHIEPHVRAMLHQRMLAALKPGGRLLLEAFTPQHVQNRAAGRRGPPPEMLYSADLLRADFQMGCIEHLEERVVDLDEGERHQGRAHVVRLRVRRTHERSGIMES